jgi:DNA polymerase III epsilon subunit-like protein
VSVVFLDTETTGLDEESERIFEIAVIGETGAEYVACIEPEGFVLEQMHPKALEVNRYYERTTNPLWTWDALIPTLNNLDSILEGRHIVGAVPDFDARFLKATFKREGLPVPRWHYHLIDVEARAVGWLAAQGIEVELPWDSDALSRLCGVEPPQGEDRHTALADARWAKALYEVTATHRAGATNVDHGTTGAEK